MILILIQLTSEGRRGKARKHLNKAMVFLISGEHLTERTPTLQDINVPHTCTAKCGDI